MNSERAVAHSANINGEPHYLDDHLKAVADLAKQLMPDATYKEVAYYAGLWHDLGKYNPRWQARLKALTGNSAEKVGIPHARQGAFWAIDYSLAAAFCIVGHHAGLPDRSDFKKLKVDPQIQAECITEHEEVIAQTTADFPNGLQPQCDLPAPTDWEQWDLMTRFLFSALVDADYTDTSEHFAASRLSIPSHKGMRELLAQFNVEREKLIANSPSNPEVNRVRTDIYNYCVQAGSLPKGLFKLAAPTGGGKTFSLMGFGLHHAITNNMRRIIYAAPFTSIIDQTADIYRRFFGKDVVLEHHSAVKEENLPNDPMGKVRLAAQNWDFPIIVTTTVQLFESLFSNIPSQCRKVHNIANSVIVLDEVQALPIKYLEPILRMLQALSNDYGCSVVFCTATQPAYQHIKGLKSQITEIIPSCVITEHFNQLKRVEYLNKTTQSWNWEAVVTDIQSRACEQVLIVCNSTADAQAGFKAMQSIFSEPECFHLSTRMYGAHRRRVLAQIQERLKLTQRICLVSTQLIEAGVDLDFADGYRVIAPLDSVVQTAGRINRNGRLERLGTLTVFRLEGGKFPGIDYELAARDSCKLIERGEDLNTPQVFEKYFRRRFKEQNTDQQEIQHYRREKEFKTVNARFKLIDDDTIPVFIDHDPQAQAILKQLEAKSFLSDNDYRNIQSYLVNLKQKFLTQRMASVRKTPHELLVWTGNYDDNCGII